MSELGDRVKAANEQLAQIVLEVCRQCRTNCCHQGTMMGSQGLRRLEKGLQLCPDLAQRLRTGLAERLQELRVDLEVAERVGYLLHQAALGPEAQAALPALDERLQELRSFVERATGEYLPTAEGMSFLLLYSAVRSNLLRCLRRFPGAEALLANLAQGRGSFTFRGRKIAPPRCILHHQYCLAEEFKPVKCANFFCTGDPNLLARCRQSLSFDEFVLANARVADEGYVLQAIELENRLGQPYWEPKVVIGPEEQAGDFRERVLDLLRQGRSRLTVHSEPGRFMKATNEIIAEIKALASDENLVYTCATVDGAALYELAVALERARGMDWHGGLVLLAERLSEKSFMPHPLWDDEMISQPLGGLDIYVL